MKKILAIWLGLTAMALADGMDSYQHAITYKHQYAVDSAQAYFVYNGDSSLVSLLPVTGSSHRFLFDINPTIDSVGLNFVRIEVYSGGAVIDSFYSTFMNFPDTSVYQGAASGLSAGDIWDYDLTGWDDSTAEEAGQYVANIGIDGVSHTIGTVQMKIGQGYTGAAGSNIEDDLDTLLARPSGSGPRLCSLFVATGAGAAMTSGFSRMTSGAITWTSDINGDGYAIYSLTDATWSGLVYVTAHTQDTIPQTFVVTADLHDTITVTAHVLDTPSGPDLVNAYIYTFDLVGDTVVNARMETTVNGNPPFRDADSNLVAIPRKVVAYSDTLGLIQQEIRKSSTATDINGNPVTYNFKITKKNYFSALFDNRTAPDSTTWQIK